MRCLHVALKLVASAVPMAAVAFVSSAPASAHARHSYRHVYAHQLHYSGRHLYAMNTNNFASRAPYTSQYFASPYAMGQSSFTGNGSALPARYDNVSTMAASQVGAAGLPASLVERVIRRESGGNPRAVHAGNYGLMQIRLATARAMGYTGSAAGLLEPQTNMTYALRYLAGAWLTFSIVCEPGLACGVTAVMIRSAGLLGLSGGRAQSGVGIEVSMALHESNHGTQNGKNGPVH